MILLTSVTTTSESKFGKLVFLIDTHYRSMLLAERFATDPAAHSQWRLRNLGWYEWDRFVGVDDFLFDTGFRSPLDWREKLLPPLWGQAGLNCFWLAGGPEVLQVSIMTFCAERGMARLLEVKGRAGGLNTDRLSGKNCHYWPFPETDKAPPLGAVVEDKMINVLGHEFAVLDMMHALHSNEGAIRTYFSPEAMATTWSEAKPVRRRRQP